MRELITIEQADRLFLLIALIAPVAGLLLGAAGGARRGAAKPGAMKGLLIGLLGPINLILWKVYNGITDRLGLDTVKNLLVNIGLFIGIGIVAGLAFGYYARSRYRRIDDGGGLTGVAVGPIGPAPVRLPGAERDPGECGVPPRNP